MMGPYVICVLEKDGDYRIGVAEIKATSIKEIKSAIESAINNMDEREDKVIINEPEARDSVERPEPERFIEW